MKIHPVHSHLTTAKLDSGHGNPARERRCGACLVSFSITLLLWLSAVGEPLFAAGDAPASRWYGAWIQVSPAELGYDPARLQATIDEIGKMRGVQGLLLLRHGYLVAEQYWRGGAHDVPHNLKSASKSVISALVGLAVDGGYFQLNQPVVELLPGLGAVDDPAKQNITVRHLLMMTSGLQSQSYQAYNQWVVHADWVKSAFAQPLVSAPGARYGYSTANSHLLSAILAGRTGKTTRAFAQSQLFDPMGIEIHDWLTDPNGIHIGGNNLWLKPRDLAKFGQLYLDRGRWGNRQLLSTDWVVESTRPGGKAAHETYGDYGFLWWTPNHDGSFAAVGYGGQYILVSPRDDTVIVITSTLVSKGDHWENKLFGLLRKGIAGSLVDPGLPRTAVTSNSVKLRAAPGTASNALEVIPKGERLELFGRRGEWLKVRHRGQEGWLHADYATLTAPTVALGSVPPPGKPNPSNAGVQPAADVTPAGQAVPVPRSRLDRLREQVEALDDLAQAPPPLPRYRTTGVVNFRRSPNLVGALLGQLQPGTEFQALERSEAWLMTRIDGELGWVHSDFADVIQVPSPEVRREQIATEIGHLLNAVEHLGRAEALPTGAGAPADKGQQQRAATTELAQLRAANDSLQRSLQDAEKLLGEAQQKSAIERGKMVDQLVQSQQLAQSLSVELDQLRAESLRQGKMLAGISAESDSRSQQLAAANDAVAAREQALQDAENAGAGYLAQADQLRKEKQALQRRLQQLESQGQSHATKLDDTRQQLAALRDELAQAESQRDELDKRLQDSTARNAELQVQLSGADARSAGLAAEIAQALQAIEGQHQALDQLRDGETKRAIALQDSREEIASLQALVNDERDAKDTLAAAFAELQKQAESLQAALSAVSETAQQRQAQLDNRQAQIQDLQAALSDSQAQQAAVAEKLDNTTTENRALQQQLSAQRELAQQQLAAVNQAETSADDLGAQLGARERDLQQLKTQLDALRAQDQARQQDLAAASATLEAQRRELEDSRARINGLEAQLAFAEQGSGVLDQRSQRAEALNAGLQSALLKEWMRTAMAVTDAGQLRSSARQREESMAVLERQNAEQAEKLVAGEARIAALQSDLSVAEEARQALQADADRLREENTASEGWLNAMRRDSESVVARMASLEQALQKWQGENEALQVAVEQQQAEVASQAGALAKQQLESAAQTAALQSAHSEIAALEDELREAAETRQARELEIAAQLEQQQTESKRLQGLLAQSREAAARDSAQLETEKARIARAEEALSQEQATIAALNEELQGLRRQAATQHEQLVQLRVVEADLEAARAQLTEQRQLGETREQAYENLLAEVGRLQQVDRERQQQIAALTGAERQRTAELAAATAELGSLRHATEAQLAQERVLRSTLDELRQQNGRDLVALHVEQPRVPAQIERLSERSIQDEPAAEHVDQQMSEPVAPRVTQVSEQVARVDIADAPGPVLEPPAPQPVAETGSETPLAEVAAAPVATPTPTPDVEAFVREWAAAWSRQDVDAYLARYAADFEPAGGATRPQWAAQRRVRLTRPKIITVKVDGFEVAPLDGAHARVTFQQAYRANHYKDRVSKTLELRLEDGDWKILREISH